MKAEIIAVGSELLTPDHTDTNSLYLTEKLNETGYQVHLKTIVGDSQDDIAGILHAALARSNLIVFSGGLGPTEDDLTRAAVAGVLKRALVLNPEILDHLRIRFAQRGYHMARNNEKQAEVIDQAEILPNAFGTAPGMWIEEKGRYIVLLPGPPREIKPMFESQVIPRIRQLGHSRRLLKRSLRIAGLTESEVDARLAPIYTTHPGIQTIILAGGGHIAVHLHQWVEDETNSAEIEELAGRLRELLGDAIFTTTDEPLEQVVGNLLRQSGQTLAVAESCTSGMIGMRITRVPGSSSYFSGGVICYANEVKQRLCGVPEELIRKHGAVSGEVAEALACGVREGLRSSIGLSITGIAGPGGGTESKPVGLVFVGVTDAKNCVHTRSVLPGDREVVRERASFFALACLRKFLLEQM